jgi:putative tryptophan/tyrosine transport system substrate-binding protein
LFLFPLESCSVTLKLAIRDAKSAILVCAMLFALYSAVEAQQSEKTPRLGFLAPGSAASYSARVEAFRQGLHELGYAEGENIVVEYRFAGGTFDRLPELAAELVRLNVDAIIAGGQPAVHAAKQATGTIPIIMGQAGDPVGAGLIASLARPRGNITGLSDFTVGVITKRLELLKEVVPRVSNVAVLLNPANPTNPLQLKESEPAAKALGVRLLPLEINGAQDFDRAFAAIRNERAGALAVFADPMLGSHRRLIAELAAKNRLPAIYPTSENIDAGGLMSYGTNFEDLYRRAATYVDKILKGANPADLPVEQPTKFELVINLKTAKEIGLTIPPNVLARADRVIR